jgi:hypothetical protein
MVRLDFIPIYFVGGLSLQTRLSAPRHPAQLIRMSTEITTKESKVNITEINTAHDT